MLTIVDDEYRFKLEEARAAWLDAEAERDVLRADIAASVTDVSIQDANIQEIEARLWQQQNDLKRYTALLDEESVSQQQYEQIKADHEPH